MIYVKGFNMSYIYFKDDEPDNMLAAINSQQMCFHPVYAPDGQFSVKNIFARETEHSALLPGSVSGKQKQKAAL